MKCETSVITMTLLRLDYLVHGPDNRVGDTSTETGLMHAFIVLVHSFIYIYIYIWNYGEYRYMCLERVLKVKSWRVSVQAMDRMLSSISSSSTKSWRVCIKNLAIG